MPQLDFSTFPSQLFWLIICFFTMLFIMSKFIIPMTAEMVNLRKQKIDSNLKDAADIKQQVENALQKYNEALKAANSKAEISLQKTKEELDETIARKQRDLSEKLKAEIDEGEKKIASSKEKALKSVEEISADLAVQVLDKLGFSGIKTQDVIKSVSDVKNK